MNFTKYLDKREKGDYNKDNKGDIKNVRNCRIY